MFIRILSFFIFKIIVEVSKMIRFVILNFKIQIDRLILFIFLWRIVFWLNRKYWRFNCIWISNWGHFTKYHSGTAFLTNRFPSIFEFHVFLSELWQIVLIIRAISIQELTKQLRLSLLNDIIKSISINKWLSQTRMRM